MSRTAPPPMPPMSLPLPLPLPCLHRLTEVPLPPRLPSTWGFIGPTVSTTPSRTSATVREGLTFVVSAQYRPMYATPPGGEGPADKRWGVRTSHAAGGEPGCGGDGDVGVRASSAAAALPPGGGGACSGGGTFAPFGAPRAPIETRPLLGRTSPQSRRKKVLLCDRQACDGGISREGKGKGKRWVVRMRCQRCAPTLALWQWVLSDPRRNAGGRYALLRPRAHERPKLMFLAGGFS